jgi:hypothetical protein
VNSRNERNRRVQKLQKRFGKKRHIDTLPLERVQKVTEGFGDECQQRVAAGTKHDLQKKEKEERRKKSNR